MTTQTQLEPPLAPEVTPLLQAGDRLTPEEFQRRYEAMPEVKKAELIEGVVYLPAPASAEDHGEPLFDLVGCLGVYRAQTRGVRGGDNCTLRMNLRNMPQPDAYLRIEAERGGQTRMVDTFLEGGPELIAEVAASSASYDLHDKLDAYRRNGVQEYIVWRVRDRQIDWFVLDGDEYAPLPTSDDGIFRSVVFPGLWLDGAAVVQGDLARALGVLQQGIDSDAHVAFVKKLATSQSPESANGK